ncbi:MAG: S1C family serine protease, partial [Anaerolineales bacterium]|nr:S1C family serine protease [Anaerolineales bacterium]
MAEAVERFSHELATLVEDSAYSVVRVEGRRRLPATGVLWSEDGVVITAHHVVQREQGIMVGTDDGETVEADVVGREPAIDLAVLRVRGMDGVKARWTDSSQANVGNIVLALGRPRQDIQAAFGIISALSDSWRTPLGGAVDRYVQSDVVMYPGFSGGPLLTATGHMLGINTSALLRGTSLTIPTETLQRVVPELLEHGQVRRAYLGVSSQKVELPSAAQERVGQRSGLLVVSVEPGSPAEAAGLSLGDTLVELEGSPITSLEDLLAELAGERIGQSLELRALRAGETI